MAKTGADLAYTAKRSINLSEAKKKKAWMCYLMLSPIIIGFLVFTVYTYIWVMSKSFYYYTGVHSVTRFVGLQNFIDIFKNETGYWSAWLTTLQFAVIKLAIELPLAILIAVLLNQKLAGRGFFRGLYFMPQVISVAIIGLIFSNLFDYFGYVNGALTELGLLKEGIDWFSTKSNAMFVLVLGSIWSSFGINVLYFLAGLQNISEDLYESASIEGASKWTCFWKITLPLMAPIFQIVLLLAFTGTLQINDYVLVMTNGAPGGQSHFIMSYLTKKFMPGFAEEVTVNIGYGCALYFVTSVILGCIAGVYFKISNKLSNLY